MGFQLLFSGRCIFGEHLGARHVFSFVGECIISRLMVNEDLVVEIVAVPIGYILSRHSFPGKRLLDSVLDIPIVLPPLVVLLWRC